MDNTIHEVNSEEIEKFLHGRDPQKYIVAIEAGYTDKYVTLIINDPETGKRTETHPYKPFLWFKHDIVDDLYGGKRLEQLKALKQYGITIKEVRTKADDGTVPKKLQEGYKYLATCSKTYNDLVSYFKNGNVDVFSDDYRKSFVMFSPAEQFLIQSGKRMFKGMEDYNDIHRLQFDLETEGLYANKHAIFQIGVRDNKNFEEVLETLGENPQEKRDSERINIEKFFKIINDIKPDMITGYNSENFDWPFLFERADRLSIPITELAITLNRASKIKRKDSVLKLGGESEHFKQTMMYGYNIIDVAHAVRRAQAINSEIKSWGLKYITQFAGVAKPNRVYVPGDKINSTWADKVNQYAFNEKDGEWYKISDAMPLKEGYKIVTGAFIVQRYLCDDLWETEQIDYIYNQASFLIGKMLPTTFMRSSTMGTSGQWKLIMSAWSYEKGLAIPSLEDKRDFTGGLSRLLRVGYSRKFAKLDFAALYPKTELTYHIFPDLDITGVMHAMLTYVVDTRDKYKFLTSEEKSKAKAIEKDLKENGDKYTPEEIKSLKEKISEHKANASLYDKKQLPLKILANSWFGSYGAPYIFNWGDTDCAEETTCRGRQHLRHMVRFFTEKYNFKALVLDTDGCNFELPENYEEFKYTAKGNHWKTTGQAGVELTGLDAALADFNENHLTGRMGLDVDDVGLASINFARKNYANNIDGKIKFVGNSIKSKKMSTYIEEFLGKGIRLLLDDKGYEFLEFYYDYVNKIYNYSIPLVKIATKAKVKKSMTDYRKNANAKNKAGKPMPKQAHMELALQADLNVNLGDVIHYVNTGTSKSHGDLKTEIDKETKLRTTTLNCKMIDNDVLDRDNETLKELEVLRKALLVAEKDEDKTSIENRIEELEATLHTDEYNVARYLNAFNKKVKPLLVCFNPEIRDNILIDIVKVKDKITKKSVERLKERSVFTESQCKLTSGFPYKDTDQDSYEELMTMEDKEIKFWDKVNKVPNNMEPSEWEKIRADYKERKANERVNGIKHEKEKLIELFKKLEVKELLHIAKTGVLPKPILAIVLPDKENKGVLISRAWGEVLCDSICIWDYEMEAIERDKFYKLEKVNETDENRYEQWLDYKAEKLTLTGDTTNSIDTDESQLIFKDPEVVVKLIAENSIVDKDEEHKSNKNKLNEDEDEDIEEDEDDLLNDDESIKNFEDDSELEPEIPDNYGSMTPQVEVVGTVKEVEAKPIIKKELEEEDEWNF